MLPTRFPTALLEQMAELRGGFAFKSEDYAPGGRFILRTLNIREDGSINPESAIFLPLDRCRNYSRFALEPHDTLFVMVGATLGKVGYVRAEDLPALLNQNLWLIRGRAGKCDRRYLHYAFRACAERTRGWASGSARDFVRRDDYRRMELPCPPLAEQRTIARVLGTLDDKIAINRKLSATLEALSGTLFKSWFLDFDPVHDKAAGRAPLGMDAELSQVFADSFAESELGMLPRGWRIESLTAIAEFLNGLPLQKFPPRDGAPTLPIIKIAELRSGITSSTGRADVKVPAAYRISDGDLLFSWSGSLLVDYFTGGEGVLNQHLFKVSPKGVPLWFVYGQLGRHLPEFQRIAAAKATTLGHIQRHHLADAKIVLPPPRVLFAASRILEPLHRKRISTRLESRTLAALRDTLLPRLLSAELRVSDAERLIFAATSAQA